MAEPLLAVRSLTKSYDGWSKALDGVSMEVARGEFVSIIGSSGAGKSTLLRCANRLVDPTQGTVAFDGCDVTRVKGRELRQVRRRISMIFQHYNQVGLADFAYTRTDQLSGGQKQRVGIARALVQDPLLMLADEPIASLDPKSSRTVMEHLRWAADELGIACLVNLHQVDFALEFSDRIVALKRGRLVFDGSPSQLDEAAIAAIYETADDGEGIGGDAGAAGGAGDAGGAGAAGAPASGGPGDITGAAPVAGEAA